MLLFSFFKKKLQYHRNKNNVLDNTWYVISVNWLVVYLIFLGGVGYKV